MDGWQLLNALGNYNSKGLDESSFCQSFFPWLGCELIIVWALTCIVATFNDKECLQSL